jgi:two-component system KDP operon response regulator KdpE
VNPGTKIDVLVVDDEVQIRRLLKITLEEAGYGVREAESGRTALGEIALHPPRVVILDLGLPDIRGTEVLRAMRPLSDAPVLVLSVFGQESSKIEALDAGADDYLTKPFAGGELLARLRALLRRSDAGAAVDSIFRFGPIEVDFTRRLVLREGRRIRLTATEYSLLNILGSHRDQVLPHRQILRQLWGPAAEKQTQYLRTYMMRLRKKLGDDVDAAGHFQTETGIGYRFVSEPSPLPEA